MLVWVPKWLSVKPLLLKALPAHRDLSSVHTSVLLSTAQSSILTLCCVPLLPAYCNACPHSQLASENWGVIGLKFREVDCNKGLGVHRI